MLILGYRPRIALESSDSSENRIDKIVNLIKESKYGIHDLSRTVSSRKGEYFRLNMPLELGIDYGCCKIIERYRDKRLLILEKERFMYQKAASDLSGVDVKAHNDNGATIIECVRNWFVETVGLRKIPSPERIFSDYVDDFQVFLLAQAKTLGYKESNYVYKIPTVEYIFYVKEWTKTKTTYLNIVLVNEQAM